MKSKPMFSLKTYLLKKAEKKLAKLQYRAAKREGNVDIQKTFQVEAEHVHGPDCDHDHKAEDLFVDAPVDELAELSDVKELR